MSDIKSNHTGKTENAKKEDGRVRYTKMRIRSAFYELLQKTGYEKITVTSICTLAEINRATFYKHYLDVPNLVDELQKDAVNELKSKLQNAKDTSFDISIAQTLKYIRENLTDSPSVKHLIYPDSSGFTSKITDMLYEMFSNSMSPYENLTSGITKDILFSYISAGSASIIENWCKTGYKESEEDIAHSIIFLASATLKNVRS